LAEVINTYVYNIITVNLKNNTCLTYYLTADFIYNRYMHSASQALQCQVAQINEPQILNAIMVSVCTNNIYICNIFCRD